MSLPPFKQCCRCAQFTDNSGVDIRVSGGYAGYYDPFIEDEHVSAYMCHDCTVATLTFMNLIDDVRFTRGHPTINADQSPCCDNCWIRVFDEAGCWIGTKNPRTGMIAYNNGSF